MFQDYFINSRQYGHRKNVLPENWVENFKAENKYLLKKQKCESVSFYFKKIKQRRENNSSLGM